MRITANPLLNPLASRGNENRTVVGKILGNAAQAVRRDRLELSKEGKQAEKEGAGDFLQGLVDMREALKKKRQQLLVKGSSGEMDAQLAKNQIKELDKQLKGIDDQIAQFMLNKAKEALEGEKKEQDADKELTKDEKLNKQLENVAEAKANFDTMDTLRGTRAVMERSAAHQEEWAENSHSFSPQALQSQAAADSARIDKLHAGIENLAETERQLLADAQELSEQAAKTGAAPEAQQEKTAQTLPVPAAEEEAEKEPQKGGDVTLTVEKYIQKKDEGEAQK